MRPRCEPWRQQPVGLPLYQPRGQARRGQGRLSSTRYAFNQQRGMRQEMLAIVGDLLLPADETRQAAVSEEPIVLSGCGQTEVREVNGQRNARLGVEPVQQFYVWLRITRLTQAGGPVIHLALQRATLGAAVGQEAAMPLTLAQPFGHSGGEL